MPTEEMKIREQQRHTARVLLRNSVKTGKVTKEPCEICGSTKVEGHHEDYTKPLEVRWLCGPHHRALHRVRSKTGGYEAALAMVRAHPELVTVPRPDPIRDPQELREIVKVRVIAKAICITLPKSVREPLSINAGDRMMVRLDKTNRQLIVTKE